MKGSISLTIVSLCLYTCVHHKAVDSVLSLPSHIHIHTLSHIHLKHRISPRPHLSPQDAAAQSAAQVTSPECLSGGCILSCLPSWMLPSQTAFLQIAASASARNELWTPSLWLTGSDVLHQRKHWVQQGSHKAGSHTVKLSTFMPSVQNPQNLSRDCKWPQEGAAEPLNFKAATSSSYFSTWKWLWNTKTACSYQTLSSPSFLIMVC